MTAREFCPACHSECAHDWRALAESGREGELLGRLDELLDDQEQIARALKASPIEALSSAASWFLAGELDDVGVRLTKLSRLLHEARERELLSGIAERRAKAGVGQ